MNTYTNTAMHPTSQAARTTTPQFSLVLETPPAAPETAQAHFAARLSIKEMIGGLEYWHREGYAVEGTEGDAAPLYG